MADNILIQTANGNVYIRTSEEGGVHYPHHYARLFNAFGEEYGALNPIPVYLSGEGGASVSASNGGLNVSISYETSSIAIWGNTLSTGDGDAYAVVVDTDGHLQVDVLEGGWTTYEVDTEPGVDPRGNIMLAVRKDTSAPLATDNSWAPLQTDSEGRLLVALGVQGFSGTFLSNDSPPKLVTVSNGYIESAV